MPLDREHITAASRIMLPTYVVFFATLGVNYVIADTSSLNNPVLDYVDDVMPLPVWGCLFLFCSFVMVSAMATRRRALYRWALRMCGLSMLFWATVIFLATLAGDASLFSAVWSLFVATACLASDRSLARQEV